MGTGSLPGPCCDHTQPVSSSLGCHCHLCCCRHQARQTRWAGLAAARIRPDLLLGAFSTAQGPAQPLSPLGRGCGGHTQRPMQPWLLREGCAHPVTQRRQPPGTCGPGHRHTRPRHCPPSRTSSAPGSEPLGLPFRCCSEGSASRASALSPPGQGPAWLPEAVLCRPAAPWAGGGHPGDGFSGALRDG